MPANEGQPAPRTPPGAKPGQPGPPQPGAAGQQKPDEGVKIIRRADQPPEAADPGEFDVRPDADGKLRFSFRGQPWPAVLDWLGTVSRMSLDWTELPGDHLNLTTRRTYTVEEARDLINQHLLARGYTILRKGEVLSVRSTKNLDLSLVPQVEPEELADRQPHEFVKVTFKLDWLPAEKAVKEFEPILSPNAKLVKLEATNRIQAADAVINLRELYQLLKEEQSVEGQERLVQVFPLKHIRASEAHELLKQFLELEKAAPLPPQPGQPGQPQRPQGVVMRIGPDGQPQPQQPGAGGKPADAPVSLIVHQRENAIIAHAPPDKMAIISRTLEALDTPPDPEQSLLRNLDRMQVFRLSTADPETVVKVLKEVGHLAPDTRLEVDRANRALIAWASLADRYTIQKLVDMLDGSLRQFKVIRLRRLKADFVAGTINYMMGVDDDEGKQNQRYPYYFFSSRGGSEPEKEQRPFRADADVENNRLLVWANEVELAEVQNLLAELGEVPSRGSDDSTLRVIDTAPGAETDQMLERIRRLWKGPNRLLIDPGEEAEEPRLEEPSPLESKAAAPGVEQDSIPSVPAAQTTLPTAFVPPLSRQISDEELLLSLVALQRDLDAQDAEDTDDVEPGRGPQAGRRNPSSPEDGPAAEGREVPGAAPPIQILRRPGGGLIVTSQDPRALDQLEELLHLFAPRRKEYEVFELKYPTSSAVSIAYTLEEFFEAEDERKSGWEYIPFWGMEPSRGQSSPRRLSRRPPVKFIADYYTNTIIVQGADAEQLETIRTLIDLYDRKESEDTRAVRKQQLYHIRYSKAQIIADALKDVYRDLLSVNDRARQGGPKEEKEQAPVERSYTFIYGGDGDKDAERDPPIKFKGLISLGVDNVSNTIVVSASAGLLEEVGRVIEALDEAAKPTSTVRVVQVGGDYNAILLQKQLHEMFGKKPQPAAQPGAPQPGQPQPGQGQPEGQNRGNGQPAVSVQGG
ncbi:MAG: hypothetical protein KY476_09200 [Planctomycetes bacterium]|nr:hypothetical protein [Planctomycetota bacterium]